MEGGASIDQPTHQLTGDHNHVKDGIAVAVLVIWICILNSWQFNYYKSTKVQILIAAYFVLCVRTLRQKSGKYILISISELGFWKLNLPTTPFVRH